MLQALPAQSLNSGQDHFLPRPFQFIPSLLTYHATPHSLEDTHGIR
jgi:hypothetical protein